MLSLNVKTFCAMSRIIYLYSNLKAQNITMAYFMTPLSNKIIALYLLWNIGKTKNVAGWVKSLTVLT